METEILQNTSNIFDISVPSKNLVQQVPNVEYTRHQQQIKQHLTSIGSSSSDKLSKIMTNEVINIKSPAGQNMMDVYHQSGCESFEIFKNKTSLSHLSQQNPKIFDDYQQFQTIYTNDICYPLSQYKPSQNDKFNDNLNAKLMQLAYAMRNCKRRRIRQMCCAQFDIVASVKTVSIQTTSNINKNLNNDDIKDEKDQDTESEDDEDNEYDVGLDKYKKQLKQSAKRPHCTNFADKSSKRDHNDFNKSTNFKDSKLSDNRLDQIMRDNFIWIAGKEYIYARYEMIIINELVKTLTTRDNVPALSFENTPLFRHYHTINGINRIINYLKNVLAQNISHLLVFSFHILNDCVQLFCYIYKNGKIYGSRMFTKDLFNILPKFYKYPSFYEETHDEVREAFQRENEVFKIQFDPHQIYQEYKLVLFKRNSNDLRDVEGILSNRLREFVNKWISNNEKNDIQFNLDDLMSIFVSNYMDCEFFKNEQHETIFFKLLFQKNYSIGFINALWCHLSGNKFGYTIEHRQQSVISIKEKYRISQLKQQIQRLQNDLQMVLNKLADKDRKIDELKQQLLRGGHCMSLSSSSSGMTLLQQVLISGGYGTIFIETENVNNDCRSLTATSSNHGSIFDEENKQEIDECSPNAKDNDNNYEQESIDATSIISFDKWSSCKGITIGDQSTDEEDITDRKYNENDNNNVKSPHQFQDNDMSQKPFIVSQVNEEQKQVNVHSSRQTATASMPNPFNNNDIIPIAFINNVQHRTYLRYSKLDTANINDPLHVFFSQMVQDTQDTFHDTNLRDRVWELVIVVWLILIILLQLFWNYVQSRQYSN